MTYYLKYRPKTLEELDLEGVRENLKNVVKSGNIPQALLFSGPRGLGKTSAARLIAKIVNCDKPTKDGEPCNKCSNCRAIGTGSHLDVIELDAASNRGIDDIRTLREGVKLYPVQGTKKVYIIDEAHMLTTEAASALLKTLEEPPEHVIFILATTNPEKIIDTIRSRATNIEFNKPNKEEIMRALGRVVKGEKLSASPDFMNALVDVSEGSFRDAVKKLEQSALHGGKLDMSSLHNFYVPENEISELCEKVFAGEVAGALEILRTAEEHGNAENFIEKLISFLHAGLLASAGLGGNKITGAGSQQIAEFLKMILANKDLMRVSPIASLPLSIVIVKWCAGIANAAELAPPKAKPLSQKVEVKSKKKVIKLTSAKQNGNGHTEYNTSNSDFWKKVLAAAKPRNKGIETLLLSARPISFDGDILTLGVYYSFHKERLETPPHRQTMDDILKEVFGKNIKVICRLASPPQEVVEKTEDIVGVILEEPQSDAVLTQKG